MRSRLGVLAAISFADAIVWESGLSFLGIGIPAPSASWGGMIRHSYGYFITGESTYLALIPSLALIVVIWAFIDQSSRLKRALGPSWTAAGERSW
jgi:peptide/nickel transport system permease protein